eukprot:1149551-Pelagomonas_calceolata.AAC.1
METCITQQRKNSFRLQAFLFTSSKLWPGLVWLQAYLFMLQLSCPRWQGIATLICREGRGPLPEKGRVLEQLVFLPGQYYSNGSKHVMFRIVNCTQQITMHGHHDDVCKSACCVPLFTFSSSLACCAAQKIHETSKNMLNLPRRLKLHAPTFCNRSHSLEARHIIPARN